MLFSRARVLNALARLAGVMFPGALFVLHDIDLIPDADRAALYALPIPSPCLVTLLNFDGEYAACAGYIGGVCAVSQSVFFEANGFMNAFAGWGGEDDAIRNAFARIAGRKDGFIHVPSGGRMLNMETCPTCVLPDHVRARDDDRFRMPKDDKLTLKRRSIAGPNTDGVAQLAFGVAKKHDLGQNKQYVLVFTLEVNVVLPPGWETQVSASKASTYYSNPAVTTGQWQFPSGTRVARWSGSSRAAEGPAAASDGTAFVTIP